MPALEEGCLFLVDKPLTWTSFDAVRYLKKVVGIKVGHAGTLDPLATGLLIVCGGRWTKHMEAFQKMTKVYSGTIVFGACTPTFDRESEESEVFGIIGWDQNHLEELTKTFIGITEQQPPDFSAKKINGKKAYEISRAGEKPDLKKHSIEVTAFHLSNFREHGERLLVDFRIDCSKGTYIRSLAHDLGRKAGFGGYLHSLRREQIGPYKAADALSIEDIRSIFPKNDSQGRKAE